MDTAQIAQDEHDIHANILSFLEQEGFRDASHSNDTPQNIAFPPVMHGASEFTERVRAGVQRLAQAEQQREISIIDSTVSVAMRAYGMFMLGYDDEASHLLAMSRVLESDPLAASTAPHSAEVEHHVAVTILAAAVNGLALERRAVQGEAERLRSALASYERAIALHEQLRGNDAKRGARTAPFVDEAERWTETALYRTALLTMRLKGDKQGLQALRAYQAKEHRWPSTFRMPQRNVLRNIQATLLNQSRTAAPASEYAVSQGPRVHTTTSRRMHPPPPVDKPSSAWSSEFNQMKRTVIRTLEQTTSFPRADESNANAEKLADQLVLSWRLDGAKGGTNADEVVDLLYGLTRITFRSQTIERLLVQMLVAAEAFEEASVIADKYSLLVESTWQASGVPESSHTMHNGRGVDSVEEYIDTVLLIAYVEMHYLNNVTRSHERAHRLLVLVGYIPSQDNEKEGVYATLPTVHVDRALLARILRAAGSAAFVLARDSLPSQRPDRQAAALIQLRDATTLDPEAAESHYALAVAAAQAHEPTEALASARRALELEPAGLDAWHLIVLLVTASKDYAGALQLAEKALEQADSDEAADAQIPANGAPSALTRLASYDYPPSVRERGASYVRLLATYNVLVELTEGVHAALAGQQELFEAFRERFPLVSLPPGKRARDVAHQSAPKFSSERPHELTETPAEARQAFELRNERRLLQSLWLMSAASFRRAGDLDQARDAIQEAESLDSLQPDLWVQLALWCLEAQKSGAAVTCLYKALACEADHVPASVHLARLLLQPDALHLRASHAETIAAVGTAQHGAEALTRQSVIDEGAGQDLELEARASNTLSLGARTERADNEPVASTFAWRTDPSIPPLSIAEGLLRTTTLYRGHDVPEAWHLLAQFAHSTGRPNEVQRKYLQNALRLEQARPLRPFRVALALP
ncbi:hypothetical protein MOBT1_000141 [Malassezia obtusa]|uniref:Uncharacterized protein n=1 Tax=Malassezia obtusa TaxID=76774 RepID=A0AAF0IUZ3_9BASI|nr:hypothetical protein MOBT1_000141 [Malassezia obtusa]